MSRPRTLVLTLGCALAFALACGTTAKEKKGDSRAAPDEPWREARPPAGPVPEFRLPVFHKTTLRNGMTLYVIEEHSLPMIAASVVVRAGSAQDGKDGKDAGLAALAYDLLDEGAGSMNNLALANAFAALGTRVSTGSAREYGSVSADLLKKHADAGLELLATVVKKPMFAAADFERVRANQIAALKAREGEPSAIAESVMQSLIFGAEHPYGHDDAGTVASLEKLTAARAKKFWTDNAGPKNSALVLAGDVTVDEAKKLADKHFGKWTGLAKDPKAPEDPKPRSALTIAFVDVPGSPQTVVRVARAALSRGDPEEGAHIVFNEILGGAFTSRLNLKLREEKQWTYGAFSYSDRRLGRGPYVVGADVQTPNTVDSLSEILAQFDGMKGGVTDDELSRAKEGWVKSLPSWLGLPAVQVNAAAQLFAYDLDDGYYDKLVEAVNAVKIEDVKKMAERVLVKEDMVVVLVGDKATVEPKLKEKALGDVGFFGRDGSPAQ